MKSFVRIVVIAFLINLVWENLHSILYDVPAIGIAQAGWMLVRASVIDAAIVVLIWFALAIVHRNARWHQRMNVVDVVFVLSVGLAIAVGIEYHAVFVRHAWAYGPWMPVVSGIGVTPLVQLALTSLAVFWVEPRIQFSKKII